MTTPPATAAAAAAGHDEAPPDNGNARRKRKRHGHDPPSVDELHTDPVCSILLSAWQQLQQLAKHAWRVHGTHDISCAADADAAACDGIMHRASLGCLIDHRLQINTSYTSFHLHPSNSFALPFNYHHLPPQRISAELCEMQRALNECYIDRMVSNNSDEDIVYPSPTQAQDHTLEPVPILLPRHSVGICADIAHVERVLAVRPPEGFQLIVLDPPWQSKSVQRAKRYECMDHRALLDIPMQKFMAPTGADVAMWVTHNSAFSTFIKEELFPAWHVEYVTTWYWLKVTDHGEMVMPLYPSTATNHRKPSELLLIGQYRAPSPLSSSQGHVAGAQHAAVLPRDYVLVSVPGTLQHSRKPQLNDLFAPYFPSSYHVLELFARNLVHDTVSFGNECLQYQALLRFEQPKPGPAEGRHE